MAGAVICSSQSVSSFTILPDTELTTEAFHKIHNVFALCFNVQSISVGAVPFKVQGILLYQDQSVK